MSSFVARFVSPYRKFIAAALGIVAVFLAPADYDYIVSILTAAGVWAVPNG